jgi:hypothetical protein
MALLRTAGWGGSPPGDQRCNLQPGRSEPSGERCSSMKATISRCGGRAPRRRKLWPPSGSPRPHAADGSPPAAGGSPRSLVTEDQDYAFARPGLVAHKRRKLELTAGAPSRRGNFGAPGAAYNDKQRRQAERAVVEQAERAYATLVAHWRPKGPSRPPRVAVSSSRSRPSPSGGLRPARTAPAEPPMRLEARNQERQGRAPES